MFAFVLFFVSQSGFEQREYYYRPEFQQNMEHIVFIKPDPIGLIKRCTETAE